MFLSKNFLRVLFLYYSYFWNLFLFFLNILPPFMRNLFYKLLFKPYGKRILIDYGVYFRFPKKIYLGSDITISTGVKIFPSSHNKDSKIVIKNNVRIGPNVMFLGAGLDYHYLNLPDIGGDIIEENFG